MKIALVLLSLIFSNTAFAGDLWLLTFKDGGTHCAMYVSKGTHYCYNSSLGEICYPKADVTKTVKVKECVETTGGAEIPNSLKENQYVYTGETKGKKSTGGDDVSKKYKAMSPEEKARYMGFK